MSYKSPRLLTEKIHSDIDFIRKQLMVAADDNSMNDLSLANGAAQEQLNDLRKLVDELSSMASRPSIDDVQLMRPADYVEAMKPLVRRYHQALLASDTLPACLCADLQAAGVLLVVIGDGRTVVRAAHHPDHPEVALAIEAMIDLLDRGTKEVVEEGVTAAEAAMDLPPMTEAEAQALSEYDVSTEKTDE